MGVSTNGQICFGLYFDQDTEFPWDSEEFDGDFNDWWWIQSGWMWYGEQPFTTDGDYALGFSSGDPRISAYYDSRREWLLSHPSPAAKINYQSGECPAYILAVPSSILIARRGYPKEFNPTSLRVSESDVERLVQFCEKYGLEFLEQPKWYLSSYWG